MATNYILITDSGDWTVPAGVSLVMVRKMVGGGAAGGSSVHGWVSAGAGGGSPEFIENVRVHVTPGEVIPVTIGAAGIPPPVDTGGDNKPYPGSPQNGGDTIFKYLRCQGGWGGASNQITQYQTSLSGAGGGINGGHIIGTNPFEQPSVQGTRESNTSFGGASGGNPGPAEDPSWVGGYNNGYYGGVPMGFNGGGGGSATVFGPGGDGGPVNFPGPNDGLIPPAGSYGAGGGGVGFWNVGITLGLGGYGRSGAVLISWMQ